jgi:purine-binding chemotaxis protein CheW
MEEAEQLLVFTLDEQKYALHLSAVERVVRVIEITSLPKAPEIVLGVINMHGRIIPVVDIRKRFRLKECEIGLSDQLIIANTATRPVALIVDFVTGVIEQSKGRIVRAEKIVPGTEYVEGVLKLDDGMVLIHDLDGFLSLKEEKALERAMRKTIRRD